MTNPRTIARLEARIHERAAYCLQFEVSDPRAAFITITRVQLSPDITSGKIYYSVLGDEGDKSRAQHMLSSAAGFIQRQVSRVLHVRRMPHLKWYYDDSLANAANLDLLIRQARERDAAINPALAAEVEAQSAAAAADPNRAASSQASALVPGDEGDDFEDDDPDLAGDVDEDAASDADRERH